MSNLVGDDLLLQVDIAVVKHKQREREKHDYYCDKCGGGSREAYSSVRIPNVWLCKVCFYEVVTMDVKDE